MKFKLNKNLFKVIYEGIEGYVITDKTLVGIKDWFYYEHFGEDIICQANSNTDLINLSNTTDYFYKIIASTFPLGDLPQFVIKTIIPNSGYKEGMFGYTDTEIRVAQNAFKEGWNKHAEKYKFTEEDVKKAITLAREVSGMEAIVKQLQNEYLNREDFQYTEEEIIQSLQKPKEITEIEFEMEINQCDGCISNYPIINGVHQIPYPSGKMVCKANLYNNLKITKSIKYPNGLLIIKNVKYE